MADPGGNGNRAVAGAALGLAWAALVAAAVGPGWPAWPGLLREFGQGLGAPAAAGLGRAVLRHAILLAVAGALLLACRGAGARGLHILRVAAGTPVERWCVSIVLGFGVLGTAAFGLALAGLFFPAVLGVVALLAITLAIAPGVGVMACTGMVAAPRVEATRRTPQELPVSILVALLVGAPAVLAIPLLFVPSPYIDTYQYHLAAPEQFVKLHRFVTEGSNAGFHLQLTAELLNAAAVLFRRDELAAWIPALPYVAALAVTALWIGGMAGPLAAGVAVGLAVTLQPVLLVATTGKNDLAVAGCSLLALVAQARGRRVTAAACWGLACGCKISGFAFAGLAWLGWEASRIARARRPVPPDAGWLLLLAPVPLAWLAKEWLMTGDPMWPVFSRWLPEALWDPASQRGLERLTGGPGIAGIPAGIWAMFRDTAPGILVLVPFLVMAPGSLPPGARRAGAVTAVMLAVFAFGIGYEFERLALPLLAFWGALGAAAAAPRVAAWPPAARAAALALLCACAWAPVAGTVALSHGRTSIRYLLGAATAQDVVARVQTTLWETREALGRQPDVRGVLLVSENSVFRFPGRIRTETFHDRKPTWVLVHEASDLRRLLVRLKQQDTTHIVCNLIRDTLVGPTVAQYQYYPWTDRDLDLFAAFMERNTRLVVPPARVDHANGGFHVWRVEPGGVPGPEPVHFLPGIQEVKSRLFQPLFGRKDYGECRARTLVYMKRYPRVLCFLSDDAVFASFMGRREDAFREFSAVVRAGFIGDHTHLFLGQVAIELDRPLDAIPPLERALKLYPDMAAAIRERLAAAYGIQARHLLKRNPVPPEALQLARTAVEMNPASPALRDALGSVLFRIGLVDEAAGVWREMQEKWPADRKAQDVARRNLALCAAKKASAP